MTRALFLLPLLAGIALPCLAQAELRIFKIEPDKKRIIVRFDSDSPLGKQDRLKVQTYSSQGGDKTTCAFTVTAISGSLAAARSSNCPDVSILSTDAPVTREGGKLRAFGGSEASEPKSRGFGFKKQARKKSDDYEENGFSKKKSSWKFIVSLGYGLPARTADQFGYSSTGTEVYEYQTSGSVQFGLGASFQIGSDSNPWGIDLLGIYSSAKKVSAVSSEFVNPGSNTDLSVTNIIIEATPWLKLRSFQLGAGLNYSIPSWTGPAINSFPVQHAGGLGFQLAADWILGRYSVGLEYQLLGSKVSDNPNEANALTEGSGISSSLLLKTTLRW